MAQLAESWGWLATRLLFVVAFAILLSFRVFAEQTRDEASDRTYKQEPSAAVWLELAQL